MLTEREREVGRSVRGEKISSKYISEVTLNEKAYILKIRIRVSWFYSKYDIYKEKHEN